MRTRTGADRRARETAIATSRQEPGLRAVAELWRSFTFSDHDLREAAKQIAAPTLVLWGRHDPVFPLRSVAGQIQHTITHAELIEFDSGHVPQTTDPTGVAAQLIPFADAVFASGPRPSGRAALARPARQPNPARV